MLTKDFKINDEYFEEISGEEMVANVSRFVCKFTIISPHLRCLLADLTVFYNLKNI